MASRERTKIVNRKGLGGPRTARGKEIAAANLPGIKHGLYSSRIQLLEDENKDEFDKFRQDILAELAPDPRSPLELAISEDICWCMFRRARLIRFEGGAQKLLLKQRRRDVMELTDTHRALDLMSEIAHTSAILDGRTLDKTIRLEAFLSRQLLRNLQLLALLKSRRREKMQGQTVTVTVLQDGKSNPDSQTHDSQPLLPVAEVIDAEFTPVEPAKSKKRRR